MRTKTPYAIRIPTEACKNHVFTRFFLTAACSFMLCVGPIELTAHAMEPAGSGFMDETSVSVMSDTFAADIESENGSQNVSGSAGADAAEFALSKLGYPYSMARRDSGEAFDCSSLMYYAYQDAGIDISHGGATSAAEIARGLQDSGDVVAFDSELQPGDMIFYSYKRNGRYKNISHVAMYIGDGYQVEASYSKQEVAVRELSFDEAVMIGRPCP